MPLTLCAWLQVAQASISTALATTIAVSLTASITASVIAAAGGALGGAVTAALAGGSSVGGAAVSLVGAVQFFSLTSGTSANKSAIYQVSLKRLSGRC